MADSKRGKVSGGVDPGAGAVSTRARGADPGGAGGGGDLPSPAPAQRGAGLAPPAAPRRPRREHIHGQERVDEYFWLREKDSPDVLAYLHAENAYTEAFMKPTEELQEALYGEMLGRIKETDASAPYRKGEWLYYSRIEKGWQYPVFCRKSAADAPEVVTLDLNALGRTEKHVGLDCYEVSDDGRMLAFSLDTTGFRQFTLRIKNLLTGEILSETIERVTSAAFTADARALLYVVEDPVSKRSYRLQRHDLGSDPAGDPLLYEETDEMFDLEVERTRSGEFILLTAASRTTSEVRFVRADRPDDAFTLIEPRAHGHEYYVDHRAERFWIRTNSGGRNYRLCVAPVANPRRSSWRQVVPQREDVMLEGLDLFADHGVLIERADGLCRFRVLNARALERGEEDGAGLEGSVLVALPDPIYEIAPGPNAEFRTSSYRFSYQSPITPVSVFESDLRTTALQCLKQTEVLGGYDPAAYETRRVHVPVPGGARIPVALVYRKGREREGAGPAVLYGYGSYGYSIPDAFSSNRISLLDRGVVFAVAHIRGGGEMGKRWHDEGRMASKMNTFEDFIAVAEFLIREGWTSSESLVIQGRSAGGLLVGAVTNMRPELFKAVLAHVPFVDVVNSMLDESLPLTVGEFEEWGNPKIKDQYDAMMAYSPYDNITRRGYPSVLVTTSYNDSQVMYWEPAKYVARLRAMKTDSHPLLFKTNMEPAGHGGQSGRYDQLREVAFEYAFILAQLGRDGTAHALPGEPGRGAAS